LDVGIWTRRYDKIKMDPYKANYANGNWIVLAQHWVQCEVFELIFLLLDKEKFNF
jgi:hypothetical protein